IRPVADGPRDPRPFARDPALRCAARSRRTPRARVVRAPRSARGGRREGAGPRRAGRRVNALRRVNILYLVAGALFVAALALRVAGRKTDAPGLTRPASVREGGPPGAALFRRWLDALPFRTREIEGARFDAPADARVVLLLGVTEPVTPTDVATLRAFVRQGG